MANKDSNKHGKQHEYPYIDFDIDGNAYLVTDKDAIPYPYATDDSEREKYPDSASRDAVDTNSRGPSGPVQV
jgi:hypothetical protein